MAHHLKQRSIFWMFILTLLSLGFYLYYYLWKMKRTIDSLPVRQQMDDNKLKLFLILEAELVALVILFYPYPEPVHFLIPGICLLLILYIIYLYLVLLFQMKRPLSRYFWEEYRDLSFIGFWSGLWTVFFGIYFIQHRLNGALETVDYVSCGTSHSLYRSSGVGVRSAGHRDLISRGSPITRAKLERKIRKFTTRTQGASGGKPDPGMDLEERLAASFEAPLQEE